TLTSMQQASAVEHVPGQTWWQGVLYAQLNNAGPNVWSGSGTRIFMKRGRLCQSHLIMQMRRL
ncbi:MAG: hypothetical protein KC492_12525, partial [Myxococcales bacterium]|nr:hypothetical protein [Myxococcales bacterium]